MHPLPLVKFDFFYDTKLPIPFRSGNFMDEKMQLQKAAFDRLQKAASFT
jgi:hypothetical protein